MKQIGVLFLCTGNICRSPVAEGVFRHRVLAEGWQERVRWDSAGTQDYHVGEAPDPRAIEVAADRGVRIGDLRARQISAADFDAFDFILAMDQGHFRAANSMKEPDSRAIVSLFTDFVTDGAALQKDVPDPYYGGRKDFEYVMDLVENGVDGLIAHLRRENLV